MNRVYRGVTKKGKGTILIKSKPNLNLTYNARDLNKSYQNVCFQFSFYNGSSISTHVQMVYNILWKCWWTTWENKINLLMKWKWTNLIKWIQFWQYPESYTDFSFSYMYCLQYTITFIISTQSILMHFFLCDTSSF